MSDSTNDDKHLWTLLYLDALRAYGAGRSTGETSAFSKQVADKSLQFIKADGSVDVAISHLTPKR